MYNNRVRNIEIPENLFSNLGEIKSRKIEKKIFTPEPSPSIKESAVESDIKLTSYKHKKEYRDRISKMYEEIKNITPIDNEIDNVLYFNNYTEKGIVIKPKISSLKQFWTEYRLINNEKANIKEQHLEKTDTLDDFDELFAALSKRVVEINKYIDELKEMRSNIHTSSKQLKAEKEQFSQEKEQFLNYKEKEESKLKEEKENLKINFTRLQTIINDLDKKLDVIDE